MSHIFIIYLLITLFVSAINIFLTSILYKKKCNKIILFYILFLSTQFFDNFTSAIFNYLAINIYTSHYPVFLYWSQEISDISALILYFVFGALIINSLLNRNIVMEKIKSFFFLSILLIILSVIGMVYSYLSIIQAFKIFMYIVLMYSISLFLFHIKDISSFVYRSVLKKVALICLIIFPLVLLENVKELVPFLSGINGSFFGPTSFLIINIYGLINVSIFLFSSEEKMFDKKLKKIVSTYSISVRESEVLNLVVKGHSNIQISDELFISEGTVKNYIYSMFKKVNVNSRIQLINLLKA